MSKYKRRTDTNQLEEIKKLINKGYIVKVTSQIGWGFPDFIVKKIGKPKALMVELKSKGNVFNLTEAEIEMQSLLRNCGCQITTAESAEEIMATYNHLFG
jgi:hypothetical protein